MTEGPGPGAYSYQRDLEKPDSHESLSKRGYGGLASRHTRWYEGPGPSFNPPAPGQYEPVPSRSLSAGHPSTSTSRLFKPCNEYVPPERRYGLPGPGAYNLAPPIRDVLSSSSAGLGGSRSPSRSKKPPATSSFAGPERKGLAAAVASSAELGPGVYTPALEQIGKAHHKDTVLPSAVFRSNCDRFGQPLRTGKTGGAEDIVPITSAGPSSRHTTPGPGHYDPEKTQAEIPSVRPIRPTVPMPSTYKPRRKPVKADTPGPGQYQMLRSNTPRLISSSMFMSNSERIIPLKSDAPGPAFYQVSEDSLHQHKSFLLNTGSKWV